jgi:hypothetical protein
MLDILQRVYDRETQSSSSSDNDSEYKSVGEGGLSEATICRLLERGHLLEDGELIDINPEDLSPEELEMFHQALFSGEIQGIEVWKPWWLSEEASSLQLAKDGTCLIQVQEGQEEEEEEEEEDKHTSTGIPPPPLEPIPSLDTLTKVEPSPFLSIHILDIIYSYCFIMKRYNGDPGADLLKVMDDLMTLSSVLPPPPITTPSSQTVGEMVLNCLEKACRPATSSSESRQCVIEVLKDVITVLRHGRSVIVTLLNDLKRIVHDAGIEVDKTERKKVGAVEKKVVFFMAWANESSSSALMSASALLVQAEYEKHMQTVDVGGGLESLATRIDGRKGGEEGAKEGLIEEL